VSSTSAFRYAAQFSLSPHPCSLKLTILFQYVSSAEPFVPNEVLATLNPSFGYQVYLSGRPRAAALELNGDVRSTIRSCAQVANSTVPADFLKPNNTFLGPWRTFEMQNNLTEIPFSGIMSQKVEDYMVASYKKQGLYNSK